MNLINITDTTNVVTDLEHWKPRVEIVKIFPPSWKPTIKQLQEDNWQNKNLIRNIYKYQDNFWAYMKKNNIIPETIVEEIEKRNNIDL